VRVLRMRPLEEDSLYCAHDSQSVALPGIQEGHREGMRDSIDVCSGSLDKPAEQSREVHTPLMASSASLGLADGPRTPRPEQS
jgi:hypothetical protein